MDKKRIVSNFFSLSSIEMANYLFPLLTVPYLVRVLGPGKYGLVAFVMAFIQYFVMLTDYGFNLTATRDVSVSRDDPAKMSKIFSSVMTVKFIFILISLAMLLVAVYAFPKFRPDALLYLFAFGMVIGNVLFPIWFFQGMEKMKSIAVLNLLAKTLFLIAVFVFVRRESDYLYVPLFTSLGSILAGVAGFCLILARFKIRIIMPAPGEIWEQLKEGWNVFISMISISLVTTSNIVILGFFATNEVVGYFSAGEKIISLTYRAFNPILVAVYPYMAKIADNAKDIAIGKLRKLFAVVMLLSFAVFAGIFIFSGAIVAIVLGSKFEPSVMIVRILSPLAFIVPVAYIFANLALLPFKLDRYFARIYIFGGALNIALLLTLLCLFNAGAAGVAVSVLITQITITTLMYVILRRNYISIVNMDISSLMAIFEKKAIADN
ncbi:MAG: flippase [Candidatus Omnitrophica bacterium]|nr:flippase [Candidatus Omnitrophota bacterium]